MSHPEIHAKNSVRKFGGSVGDYLPIHQWFDDSKSHMADMRHRALKHHAAGIYECEQVFGKSFINTEGKTVYTRYVGEQHVLEDLGFIPTLEDWFENMEMQDWMMNRDKRVLKMGKKLPKSFERLL
ncbi:DUF6915 family protein [Bacillus sp. T33-2]|uniref:DUF6915 family protein n=1 Tax=Bacillus sp. T33-2 TaxID=2054168 RepID=UPI000C77E491|nr:hypothetical protein [Bacillus sp. T33-2]PLR99526.1 hypothetical protein CVD19_00250 [Bacillus sp. T33-2]